MAKKRRALDPRKGAVIVAVCLLVALVLSIRGCRSGHVSRGRIMRDLSKFWYCDNCQKEFVAEGGKPEAICSQCGKTTAIILGKKKCEDCGKEFTQFEFDTSTNGYRSGNPSANCPQCGSNRLIPIRVGD
jgi:DNA-directed RNA polymerase subunit RPC12/RpoP